MRFLPLALAALLFTACEKCDSCKGGACPEKEKPAAPAPAATPAAAKAGAPVVEEEAPKHVKPEVAVAYRGTGMDIELSVWELHCGGCAAQVEEAFAAVPGVLTVSADYESSLVKVTVADAAKRADVIAALPKALETLNKEKGKEFAILGK